MWLGSRHQLAKLTVSQLPLATTTSSSAVDIVSTANDLGVFLDGQLTMARHISSVCRAGFFQLRQLRSVRRSLTTEATWALVQAFISCRLDYCNSLLAGVADVYLWQLQSVQNAAVRLVSGAHRHDHITPVLVGLHWLPVRQRIIYKTAVLVWKCLHDAAARYLADLCVPAHSVCGRQQLRLGLCWSHVAQTATGQHSFAVNGPQTWNSLPADFRTPDTTLCSFKRHLKAHLFRQ